jgi:hypothetical protein
VEAILIDQPIADHVRCRRHQRAQQRRRKAEGKARRLAVAYAQESRQRGFRSCFAARQLGVSPRTLRNWRCHLRDRPACRGRPCKTCSVAGRNEVIRFISQVSGPAVGVEALRALFGHIPRCILVDILRRYRGVWRSRYRQHGFRLGWHRPGAVWAMDHSQATCLIDGRFEYLFAVRDLSSHFQLAWDPQKSMTACETVLVLTALFTRFGPPLVIKCDNGSAFIAEFLRDFVAKWGVILLYSPPRYPQYNGELERSNGTLKTYTHQHAVHEGHASRWTSEDVELARQLANTLSRPWGYRGLTPAEAWQGRAPISADERNAFQAEVERQRPIARKDLGLEETAELSRADQARVDRLAVPRALTELGYMTQTRADRPPKKRKRRSREELMRARLSEQSAVRSSLDTLNVSTALCTTISAPCEIHVTASKPNTDTTESAMQATPQPAPNNLGGESYESPSTTSANVGTPSAVSLLAWLVCFLRTFVPSDGASSHASETFVREHSHKKISDTLAARHTRVTMRAIAGDGADAPPLAPAPQPTRGERASSSWLRRSFAPLLSLIKAAIFSDT